MKIKEMLFATYCLCLLMFVAGAVILRLMGGTVTKEVGIAIALQLGTLIATAYKMHQDDRESGRK